MRVLLFFFLLTFLPLNGDKKSEFESCLSNWINDAENAFETVEKEYHEDGGQACGKLIQNYGVNDNGIGVFHAELEFASNDTMSRTELHKTFHSLKEEMAEMTLLSKWEYTESIARYFGNITYKKSENDKTYTCTLALKEWGGRELVELSIDYKGPSNSIAKHNPLSDEVRKLSASDTTVLAPTELVFQQDIRDVIYKPEGAQAFKALLASAETDFTSIITKETETENHFLVQESVLNPKAIEPHQVVIDHGQMRIELHLRFMELYGPMGWRMHEVTEELKNILGDDWEFKNEGTHSHLWTATRKNGENHIRIHSKVYNNRDFLVIDVIKQPYRDFVKQYPGLANGNCIEGDCANGFGTFVYNANEGNALYAYKGPFKEGKFHGLGSIYYYGFIKNTKSIKNTQSKYVEYPDVMGHFVEGELDTDRSVIYRNKCSTTWRGFYESIYVSQYNGDINENFSLYSFNTEQRQIFNNIYDSYAFFLYKSFPDGSKFQFTTPFQRKYGNCISGGCGLNATENTTEQSTLNLPEMGLFSGQFHKDGSAESGTLTLQTGDKIYMTFDHGIPKTAVNIVVPEGNSRVAFAKDHFWLSSLADMCLEGNCDAGGTGVSSFVKGSTQKKRGEFEGYYTGVHSSRLQPQKESGKFNTYHFGYEIDNPTIEDGMVTGTFFHTYENGVKDTIRVIKDVRYMLDGSETYQAYFKRKRKAEWDQRMKEIEEARAKLKAEQEAEARRQAEAQRAHKRQQSTYRNTFCHSCEGTGMYWEKYTVKDCTETIVTGYYTYTNNVKRYTHCYDRKRSRCVRCPVCGGDGHLN